MDIQSHLAGEYHILTGDMKTFCESIIYTSLPAGTGIITCDGYEQGIKLPPICPRCKAKYEEMKRSFEQSLQTFHDNRSFQDRVGDWVIACFGEADKRERNFRFLEEALELVQVCGCTKDEAHELVEYIFNRPPGDLVQEVGGVMTTLAAVCVAQQVDMIGAGEIELERIWEKIQQIRAKHSRKPIHSPLPGTTEGEDNV